MLSWSSRASELVVLLTRVEGACRRLFDPERQTAAVDIHRLEIAETATRLVCELRLKEQKKGWLDGCIRMAVRRARER